MVGKCRVVPLKPVLSIPRLDMIATVVSVQLRKELPMKYTEYFLLDSIFGFGYFKNESAIFNTFVAKRV